MCNYSSTPLTLAEPGEIKKNSVKVVIVDDSTIIVKKIKELLEEDDNIGFIDSCGEYYQAIELINKTRPDVILLDINLPGKNGIDLLRYISLHFKSSKVIMVTNQNHDHYRQMCLQMGAYAFVDKSNDFFSIPGLVAETRNN